MCTSIEHGRSGVAQGAQLLVDGLSYVHPRCPQGNFLGPTVRTQPPARADPHRDGFSVFWTQAELLPTALCRFETVLRGGPPTLTSERMTDVLPEALRILPIEVRAPPPSR